MPFMILSNFNCFQISKKIPQSINFAGKGGGLEIYDVSSVVIAAHLAITAMTEPAQPEIAPRPAVSAQEIATAP